MITHEDASPQEMADALCKAVAAGKIPALEPLKTALPLAIQHSQGTVPPLFSWCMHVMILFNVCMLVVLSM